MTSTSAANAGRVLILSNRLPVSVKRAGGEIRVEPSAGGLATGLSGVHQAAGSLWIGWPGHSEQLTAEESESLARLYAARKVRPVDLTADEVDRYYERFCNGVLWPLFHYLIGQLPLEVEGYELYEAINRRFADAAVAAYRPGDMVWVHDYQLMLVPRMIRERLPRRPSATFTTSRSRRPMCSARCRSAISCCAGFWAPT